MVVSANMVEVAALVGDTARATMLAALMGGQALTASELAYLARISASTASGHLAKLVDAHLIATTRQGRFRYYRIASPLVARMMESIELVAAIETPARFRPRSIRDDALRFARTCYDHLAGEAAVAIADALGTRGLVVLSADGGEVTTAGAAFLADIGADLGRGGRRLFCLPCLDWSERRPHIAGHVGAEICRCAVARGWFTRVRDSRALRLTPQGRAALGDRFGIDLDNPDAKAPAAQAAAAASPRRQSPVRVCYPARERRTSAAAKGSRHGIAHLRRRAHARVPGDLGLQGDRARLRARAARDRRGRRAARGLSRRQSQRPAAGDRR